MSLNHARHERTFESLTNGDLVEFYPIGHDPNVKGTKPSRYGGVVEIIEEPRSGENRRLQVSVRIKDDYQNPRVFADEYSPWSVTGAFKAGLGAHLD